MEYVDCNLCGLDDAEVLFQKRDKLGITDEEFQVVVCKRCGLLYVNPRPTEAEIGKFYPETYSWKETLEADSLSTKWMRRLEKGYRYHLLRDEVSKVIKHTGRNYGKVLDVGCGTGDRLDVFRMKGFATYGVETSDSANYARQHLHLNVSKGDLFSASFPDRFFDVVALYNVLEHTHHPKRACDEIHRILKDDGFLVVQVPNKDSLQYRIFKERWAAFDVPRDLYYFGPERLRSLLDQVGFAVKRVDHFMNWWHPPTLVLSLFPGLDPQKAWGEERKGRSPILQRGAWILSTLAAAPLTQLESCFGHGALVTYYGMKKRN